jgi:hypothetical protein
MKIHNKPFVFFIILAFVFALGFPILKAYYLEPRLWINTLRKEIIRNNKVPKENIELYLDCVYSKFHKSYGIVRKFPRRAKYTYQDKKAIVECTIEFLILDSTQKQKATVLKDSIINKL